FAIAAALEHFGEACSARGKIRDALAAFQRAHTIRERTMGSDHSSLRTSRERIADLQLQASDGSFEPGGGVGSSSGPEKYRLLPAEPLALAAPPTPTREKSRASNTRKPTLLIQAPFSEIPEVEAPAVVDPAPANPSSPSQAETAAHRDILERILQPGTAPYHDALESIRDEIEKPYESVSFAQRVRANLASVTPFLGRREVIAGGIVLVLSLLLVGVATGSHAWGEPDQTTSLGTSRPTGANLPATVSTTAASAVPSVIAANNPVSVSAPAIPSEPSRTSTQRPRVADERSSSRKGTEQKSEPKSIAIPKLSNATLSGLDNGAATAANTAGSGGDPFINQPAPVVIGNQRANFAFGE